MTEMKRSEIEVITCLCSNPLFLFIGRQGMTEMKRSEIEVITCLCSNPLFLFIGTQGMTEMERSGNEIHPAFADNARRFPNLFEELFSYTVLYRKARDDQDGVKRNCHLQSSILLFGEIADRIERGK